MSSNTQTQQNRPDTLSPSGTAYFIVGIIVPLTALIILFIVAIYLRCRRKQSRRVQQQSTIITVLPIDVVEEQPPMPDNYANPPRYSVIASTFCEKPPAYEQTAQAIPEVSNVVEGAVVVTSITTPSSSTTHLVHTERNEN